MTRAPRLALVTETTPERLDTLNDSSILGDSYRAPILIGDSLAPVAPLDFRSTQNSARLCPPSRGEEGKKLDAEAQRHASVVMRRLTRLFRGNENEN